MLLLPFFVAGCTDEVEQMKLTAEERQRVLALQNPFGSDLVRIGASGGQEVLLIGLKHCKVYRAEPEQGAVTAWTHVTEIDVAYPLPSACSRERVQYDAEYVTVEFCKTPMGAGGGCAGGISPHRSKNGRDWEVSIGQGQWTPIAKAS